MSDQNINPLMDKIINHVFTSINIAQQTIFLIVGFIIVSVVYLVSSPLALIGYLLGVKPEKSIIEEGW